MNCRVRCSGSGLDGAPSGPVRNWCPQWPHSAWPTGVIVWRCGQYLPVRGVFMLRQYHGWRLTASRHLAGETFPGAHVRLVSTTDVP